MIFLSPNQPSSSLLQQESSASLQPPSVASQPRNKSYQFSICSCARNTVISEANSQKKYFGGYIVTYPIDKPKTEPDKLYNSTTRAVCLKDRRNPNNKEK
jgi:hypothetical protein